MINCFPAQRHAGTFDHFVEMGGDGIRQACFVKVYAENICALQNRRGQESGIAALPQSDIGNNGHERVQQRIRIKYPSCVLTPCCRVS